MGRHIFLQKNNGLFVTVTKTKPSLYANYASDFYFIRKKIIQNYLELALKPLVVKLNNYFSPLRILDVGCGDGVVLNALKNIQEKVKYPAAETAGR